MGNISSIKISVKKRMMTPDGERMLDVDTEIGGGKFICLVGHSGSGKSTLLRILAGLATPEEGSIRADDEVWFDSNLKINVCPQKRDVGYMFQDLALFPNMNIEENIRFAQRIKDISKVEELLTIFGLKNLAWQSINKLSGGQKQRVALARALASNPRLLMLDEPLSAVDEDMRANLQSEILKAHRYLGATTVMVTHNMQEARKMSDQIIRIKNGKLVECDESHCTCPQ